MSLRWVIAWCIIPLSSASISQHAARVWALRNTISLDAGWRMFSVSFYGDENCSEEITPTSFLDGGHYDKNQIQFGPDKAFDNQDITVWVAQCGEHSTTGQPCKPFEAWVGADFGSPTVVYCVKICQTQSQTAATSITLSKEGTTASSDGSLWVDVTTWEGLPTTGQCVRRMSGITKMSSIQYAAPMMESHCANQAYGDPFTAYFLAKQACDQTPDCVGIYDQECGPMRAEVHFGVGEESKWTRFYDNLGNGFTLVSVFEDDDGTVIWRGSTVALDDQDSVAQSIQLPKTFRIDLASKGLLKLCHALPTRIPLSKEGSCLHLKTGALLEFELDPNTRGQATRLQSLTVEKVELCAEACILKSGCESFLHIHKTKGDEVTENNCELQGLVLSKTELDGAIEVADLYTKKGQADNGGNEGNQGNSTRNDTDSNSTHSRAMTMTTASGALCGLFLFVLLV